MIPSLRIKHAIIGEYIRTAESIGGRLPRCRIDQRGAGRTSAIANVLRRGNLVEREIFTRAFLIDGIQALAPGVLWMREALLPLA
jgi:hypothetical protein